MKRSSFIKRLATTFAAVVAPKAIDTLGQAADEMSKKSTDKKEVLIDSTIKENSQNMWTSSGMCSFKASG